VGRGLQGVWQIDSSPEFAHGEKVDPVGVK